MLLYCSKGEIEYVPINAITQEMYLCEKMLMADERNFHVWNYRNWLTSISTNKDEDNFTKKKVRILIFMDQIE